MTSKYHVAASDPWVLRAISDSQLEKFATDPDCIEQEACTKALAERFAKRKRDAEEQRATRAAKREELQDNPFDPRTEVSADAKHIASRIVFHLWVLFVLLPFVVGILLAIVSAMK